VAVDGGQRIDLPVLDPTTVAPEALAVRPSEIRGTVAP
jgi:hypothetical protein